MAAGALHDGTDDDTDYDALCSKLPEATQKPPAPSPSDLKSFPAYRAWRLRTQGIAIPESELRSDFTENPDGRVGRGKTPGSCTSGLLLVVPHTSNSGATAGFQLPVKSFQLPVKKGGQNISQVTSTFEPYSQTESFQIALRHTANDVDPGLDPDLKRDTALYSRAV